MNTLKGKIESVAKVLLYLSIASSILLNADMLDAGMTAFYLGLSAVFWAVLWFLYMFVRDAILAFGWKKPAFPLPQYVEEDAEIERMSEEMDADWSNDPGDPSSPIYSGNIGLRSLSDK